jgi:hypothetical protein
MKFVSFYSLAIFCFCACTKLGKNVTIEGRVMNPITGEGIEGIELELLRTTSGLPGGYKSVKSTRSNTDGSYEISKGGLAGYWLACRVPVEYYQIGWVQNGSNVTASTGNLTVKKGKKMHADFYAVPYGKLQIVIKNNNCFDVNDELSIFRTHSIQDFYSGVPNPAIYTGCVNQVGNLNKAPMGWYTYSGTVTKNGITTSISDSIYLEEDETEIWNINY